jgi:hypothetical protein
MDLKEIGWGGWLGIDSEETPNRLRRDSGLTQAQLRRDVDTTHTWCRRQVHAIRMRLWRLKSDSASTHANDKRLRCDSEATHGLRRDSERPCSDPLATQKRVRCDSEANQKLKLRKCNSEISIQNSKSNIQI